MPTELERPATAEDMPLPTPEMVIIRVAICAHLRVIGPKKADEFLREMARMLASEEELAAIVPIRPPAQQAAASKARRGAMAVFRALLPTFLAFARR